MTNVRLISKLDVYVDMVEFTIFGYAKMRIEHGIINETRANAFDKSEPRRSTNHQTRINNYTITRAQKSAMP